MGNNPHPNATITALVGALVTLGIYVGSLFGWDPPPEVSAAIVTVLSTLVLFARGPKRKAPPAPPTTLARK